MIKLIWAMDENHLIGNGDKIPWHIKEDLLYYKNKTKNQTVLMGDVTYYSLKGYYKDRPLPYGKIYVATNKRIFIPDVVMVNDLETFFKEVDEDLFVVGGKTIYKYALPYADMLYISRVHGSHEGDIFFPEFDLTKFELVSETKSTEVDYCVYKKK